MMTQTNNYKYRMIAYLIFNIDVFLYKFTKLQDAGSDNFFRFDYRDALLITFEYHSNQYFNYIN